MNDFRSQDLFLTDRKLDKAVTNWGKVDRLLWLVKHVFDRISKTVMVTSSTCAASLTEFGRTLRRISNTLGYSSMRFARTVRSKIAVIRRAAMRSTASIGTNLSRLTHQQPKTISSHDALQLDRANQIGKQDGSSLLTEREILNRTPALPDNECIYAIGDIHGRYDLLEQLVAAIEQDVTDLPENTRVTLVFLGDYIDRGMESRQVVDFLISERLQKFETVFLMGNHEQALLQFRQDLSFGAQWARYGGGETLYSYGITPPKMQGPFGGTGSTEAWEETWNLFRTKLPVDHVEFYQSLTHYFSLGDYVFVHAGLRPNRSLEDQSAHDMMWIRDEFLHDAAPFEKVVVHGHTPTDEVFKDYRRIGLDTGAYYSGQLSAARLFGTDIAFLST